MNRVSFGWAALAIQTGVVIAGCSAPVDEQSDLDDVEAPQNGRTERPSKRVEGVKGDPPAFSAPPAACPPPAPPSRPLVIPSVRSETGTEQSNVWRERAQARETWLTDNPEALAELKLAETALAKHDLTRALWHFGGLKERNTQGYLACEVRTFSEKVEEKLAADRAARIQGTKIPVQPFVYPPEQKAWANRFSSSH